MAKKIMDVGLQYMISLGIRPAKTLSQLEDQLIRASDTTTARELMLEINNRSDHNGNNDSFYRLKNQSLEISLALTGAFDGDILRKACNWISAHKDFFGQSILEVGCDCGVISCFLAKTLPEVQITAIDRCEEAIQNAKKLAQRLSVSNVSFVSSNLTDLIGSYDTVFSMRTVHENFQADEDVLNGLSEQASIFCNSLADYAHQLHSKINEHGLLISIERIGRNALLLGWMKALYKEGLVFDLSAYEELHCTEVGNESNFQAFISFENKAVSATPNELFDYACSMYLDYSKPQYEGWDAKIVFENRRGKLIDGYQITYPQYNVGIIIGAWTHRTDDTGLVFFQNNNGNVLLQFYDISQKEALVKSITQAIEEAKENGGRIQQIKEA